MSVMTVNWSFTSILCQRNKNVMSAMTVNWSLHTSFANVRSCVWASLIPLLCKKSNSIANKACRPQPTQCDQALLLPAQASKSPQTPPECILALKNYKNKQCSGPAPASLEAKGSFAIYFKEIFKYSAQEVLKQSLSILPIFGSIPRFT